MKRAAAILLSLMFLWLQTVASAPASFFPAKAVRECCGCKQQDCCVTSAPSGAPSLPVTVAPTGAQYNPSVPASTLAAWTLPATAPAQISAFASAPLLALGVPLFTRHCARLI